MGAPLTSPALASSVVRLRTKSRIGDLAPPEYSGVVGGLPATTAQRSWDYPFPPRGRQCESEVRSVALDGASCSDSALLLSRATRSDDRPRSGRRRSRQSR